MFLLLLFTKSFIILNILCSSVWCETGCPPAEDIAPCECADEETATLTCRNLKAYSALDKIIENSKRYTYQEVHFESSSLIYIPSSLFEEIDIKELYVKNVTLQSLFDYPPKGLNTLYKLHLDNTMLMRSLQWDLLKSLTNLKEISINNMIAKITRSLRENLPDSITHLTFYNTDIKKIFPGALDKLPNLDKFAVESSKLSQLSRNIFPKPFNGRILSFNDNKITTIDEDLFTDMPNLQFLSMKNNQISAIPESAFEGRTKNLPYFNFEGNPLTCDCQLKWLINNKPEMLQGTCSAPEHLSGTQLQYVYPYEIKC